VKYLVTTLRNGVLNEMQCGKALRSTALPFLRTPSALVVANGIDP
jgi:hypothetical protein